MPQKKNPVVAEVARAKCGSVLGSLTAVSAILKALPYSYNLDLQEVTPQLWRGLDDTVGSLAVLGGMVATASVNVGAIRSSMANDNSTAVALANHLVKEGKGSFRQAHAIVGELVRLSAASGTPLSDLAASKMGRVSGRFGRRLALDPGTEKEVLDPGRFLSPIATEGGSNPRFIAEAKRAREKDLELTAAKLSELRSSLRASERKLNATASGIAREVKSKVGH